MISNFSEEMRLELPTWLQDEIFDVTFGGSPRASVFVPVRQLCPEDGPDPPEPLRRPVEIREGTFSLTSGQGTETVAAGQCIGASLENESTYALTSDWWEPGAIGGGERDALSHLPRPSRRSAPQ
jgi:hypothetical protein